MGGHSSRKEKSGAHGSTRLPSVEVDTCNIELKDKNGFLGDRASKGAFIRILEEIRKPLSDDDALGDKKGDDLRKSEIDDALMGEDVQAAASVLAAIEEFAGELATVTSRFMKTREWAKTKRIVVGGGFRQSRVGELVIARAGGMLAAQGLNVEMVPIRHHPDEAGLVGCLHLAPSWMFEGYDSILAIDIGGSNIRCGVVETNWKKASDLSKAKVWKFDLWRHADEEPSREQAIKRLVKMLKKLIEDAEKKEFRLAPFIGISCPGLINPDGSIEKGAQNLPGNWESSRFNLPEILMAAIPEISGHDTSVIMHNDGVVQGLSEVPHMQDVSRWGVLTIGTGLGNARFTNRNKADRKKLKKQKKKEAQGSDKGDTRTKKSPDKKIAAKKKPPSRGKSPSAAGARKRRAPATRSKAAKSASTRASAKSRKKAA